MLITTKGTDHYTTTAVVRGAAIAQWIRLLFPFCRPGFESQAHHLRCHRFIKLCSVEKTKINQKGGRDLPILKKQCLSCIPETVVLIKAGSHYIANLP